MLRWNRVGEDRRSSGLLALSSVLFWLFRVVCSSGWVSSGYCGLELSRVKDTFRENSASHALDMRIRVSSHP